MAIEHLLNADFDLSLRPRWSVPHGGRARRRIDDMAWHALHLAADDDSVIVPESAPDDFARYLGRHGLEMPALTVVPNGRHTHRLSPFGWNRAAAECNRAYRQPAPHPELEVVRRVNGRSYSARLETERDGGRDVVGVAASADEVARLIADAPAEAVGWVVKSEHGNASLGNRRIRGRHPADDDLEIVRRMLTEDDSVVVERWRSRLRDLCATFEVSDDGSAHRIDVHETVNTADGAFLGALFESDDRPLAEWRAPMARMVGEVAPRLADDGYFGPACIDGLVWDDGGVPSLRPLVDLNARRQVSAGAAALWRRLGAHGTAYWRLFNRRKLELPHDYDALARALGDDAFDPRTGLGALVTAPLWIGPDRRSSDTAAVLILGLDRDRVFAIEQRIRDRFER